MRLKISLECIDLKLPLSYKSIIQGVIYNMFDKDDLGYFYHDQGYNNKEKKYKMFVISDLFGKYTIVGKNIIFKDTINFYVSSLDNQFIEIIYHYLINNAYLFINKQRVSIIGVDMLDFPHFKGIKEITIKTFSPIVVYTSKDGYFTYYKPTDVIFKELTYSNILNKVKAYDYPVDEIIYDVVDVKYEKKKIVYFKNTFYEAYQTEMVISVNYDTFNIIYNTGIGAKGSSGFGMITYKNEKEFLSI